jgi:hypothetical protein
MVLPREKPGPLALGPVSTSKPGLCKHRYLAPIKYLNSDCIVTWSVRILFSSACSFTSRFQDCDPTNIRWVAIENPLMSLNISLYFTANQRITLGSQICKWKVNEWLVLHNLCTDQVMIRSELKYLIGAKVAGIVIWNRGTGTTQPKNLGFMSSLGNNPTKTERFGNLAGFRTKPNQTAGQKPDHWWVTQTCC